MHCVSCTKLITLELSDIGLDHSIARFDVGENNVGTLYLKEGTSETDVKTIEECINGMEGYEVVKE